MMKRLKSKSGKELEETLAIVHAAYERQKIAFICKAETPTITLGSADKKQTIYLLNSYLDFCGCLYKSGRAIAVEAKMTEVDRLSITGKGGLTARQWGAGCRWQDAGALVGVIWQHKNKVRWLPWQIVREAVMAGARSIKWDQAISVPQGYGFIIHDYLAIALKTE